MRPTPEATPALLAYFQALAREIGLATDIRSCSS